MKKLDFCRDWHVAKAGGEKRAVTLPHDAMIEETRSNANPSTSGGAYFAGGVYLYEKAFFAPAEWKGKKIWLEFEGVYKDAVVTLNGTELCRHAYGYTPFWVELGAALKVGQENLLCVEVDNKDHPNSRWYTGSGIYRPVWMYIGNEAHILPEGVQVTTLSYAPAQIRVKTEHAGGEVSIEILDGGKTVATGTGDDVVLDIPNAKLWSDETPNLYTCKVTLNDKNTAADCAETQFGIRKVEWSPKGLFINGKETLLRGACIHHDNGILGARCFAQSEARRVRILKEAGFNAIRSSHNPTSKALLEACDRYGIYVMDETWDMWFCHKNKYDYATDFMATYKEDILALVRRDYNHPSVIMYSIANEIGEPAQEKGIQLGKEMIAYFHELDSTRPITAGINLMIVSMAKKGRGVYKEDGTGMGNQMGKSSDAKPKKQKASGSLFFNMIVSIIGGRMNKMANNKGADESTTPILDALDIAGYNYASGRYPLEATAHPGRIVVGSETFPQDIAKNWEMVKKYPYLIGDFMWTGWDYLGEVGIGTWTYHADGSGFVKPYPWLLADVGVIDIIGTPHAGADHAAAVWGLRNKPAIHVRPANHPGQKPTKSMWRGTNAIASWSWKNCAGNKAVVEVYTGAAEVELLQNSSSLGRKKVHEYRASFDVKYAEGTLCAIAFDAKGQETGRSELQSATGALHICAQAEETEIHAGEIVHINIELVGENGIVESNDDRRLQVLAEGCELLAFGSANPRTEESYCSGSFTTHYGRALAVVRTEKAGTATLRVTGENLEPATVTLAISE